MLTQEKKILPSLLQDSNPISFDYQSGVLPLSYPAPFFFFVLCSFAHRSVLPMRYLTIDIIPSSFNLIPHCRSHAKVNC